MTDQELKQYCGAVTVPDREIMDAARRRQAEQLVTALEGRDELALLEASMLLEKIPKEELPRLLDQVIAALGARLPQSEAPRRLLRAAELVQKLRGAAELNANPGQLSGWLCAAMFIKH